MNYSNRDLTNREFNISRVEQKNMDSYIKTYNSDVTTWTFFLGSDWTRLLDVLQDRNERPQIDQILEYFLSNISHQKIV